MELDLEMAYNPCLIQDRSERSLEMQLGVRALIDLSHRYGGDPSFCIAGGGNTSFKTETHLIVKASGHALASLGFEGLVKLDRSELNNILAAEWPADPDQREALFTSKLMSARVSPELGQRPSIETLLHHLIPRRFVVHTHATLVNAVTCSVGGVERSAQWFGDRVLWVPYRDPGVMLAKELAGVLARACIDDQDPIIIFMANHGLIVAADSPGSVIEVTSNLVAELSGHLGATSSHSSDGKIYPDTTGQIASWIEAVIGVSPDQHVMLSTDDAIMQLVGTSEGRHSAMLGPLVPDQIVYCRSAPLWIDPVGVTPGSEREYTASAWQGYKQEQGVDPWVVLIAGGGLLAVRESKPLAQITCDAYTDSARLYRMAASIGGARALTHRDRAFIENWEAESYRRSVVHQQAHGS